jgi:hypothetical protein
LLHRNNMIVIQKKIVFSGNMSARTKISERIATYCNKLLIHRNNNNNKIDQLSTLYCNSDSI